MRKSMLAALLAALIASAPAFAQKAFIAYVEGRSDVKSSAGSMRAAKEGGTITYGESILTGKDGLVELKLENGSTIRVAENSVFSYSSTGSGTDSTPVLATTAGKVHYKLNKALGRSPTIQTNSMVAGVRGTEFTVFAGRDGSVMLAVDEGIVDVSSQGSSVELLRNEAVEVAPGKKPGAKFTWLGKELDFSSWNTGKTDGFLADPIAGLAAVEAQLAGYKVALDALKDPYRDATETWRKASARYKELLAEGNEEAIKAFQTATLFPSEDARAVLILNIRYHALNYLSVRRYVVTNMYLEMKGRYPVKRTAEVERFFQEHAKVLARYEEGIVPELNANDY
jgi:hypothetical protein